MGAEKFNFASEFIQDGRFLASNFVVLQKILRQEEYFPTG